MFIPLLIGAAAYFLVTRATSTTHAEALASSPAAGVALQRMNAQAAAEGHSPVTMPTRDRSGDHPPVQLHFSFTPDELTVIMLKNPNLPPEVRDQWMMRTAENPYFSKGAPGSIALGWG